jgi:hypothetical protein
MQKITLIIAILFSSACIGIAQIKTYYYPEDTLVGANAEDYMPTIIRNIKSNTRDYKQHSTL